MSTDLNENMDFKTFLGLPEEEQWETFWDRCIFVEHYIDLDCKCHLYRLHDFYVELTSGPGGLHNVLNAFVDGPRLDKYVEGNLMYIKKTLRTDLP